MKVGESVRKAIDESELGELESAMLHACNAVDGTAKKLHPTEKGNATRFTRVLRDNYGVLGPMGAPGINLAATRFPVKVGPQHGDIADIIYAIHRCTHGHGDELPAGFELLPATPGPASPTCMTIEKGKVRLSDRVIFGLLAVAVFSVANADQKVPDGYHLTFGGVRLPINDWWGRASDFALLAARHPLPSVTLDFGDWMDP